MLRKLTLAVTVVATLAVTGLVSSRTEAAHGLGQRHGIVARPANNVYYYHNGPTKAFFGPNIGVHSNAYDIGPYGPGYGWPYRAPVGYRYWVTF